VSGVMRILLMYYLLVPVLQRGARVDTEFYFPSVIFRSYCTHARKRVGEFGREGERIVTLSPRDS
jgi:hypothetical protein